MPIESGSFHWHGYCNSGGQSWAARSAASVSRNVNEEPMKTRVKEGTSMVTGRLVGSRHGVTVAAALVSVIFAVASASAQNTFPASGAVGIGTMNPTLSLDVRGQIRFGDANSAVLNLG